jgi:putative transposase
VAMTEPREVLPEELARRAAAAGSMDALKASGAFDELMAQIDSRRLELDGKDGCIQQLIKGLTGTQAAGRAPRASGL